MAQKARVVAAILDLQQNTNGSNLPELRTVTRGRKAANRFTILNRESKKSKFRWFVTFTFQKRNVIQSISQTFA